MVCNKNCNASCGCQNNGGCNRPNPVRTNCQCLAKDVERSLQDLYAQADMIQGAFNALEEARCIKPAHHGNGGSNGGCNTGCNTGCNCGCTCECNCGCNSGCIQPREHGEQCGCERKPQVNCCRLAEHLEKSICGLYAKINAAKEAFETLVDEGCIQSNDCDQSNNCGCQSNNCGCQSNNCGCQSNNCGCQPNWGHPCECLRPCPR